MLQHIARLAANLHFFTLLADALAKLPVQVTVDKNGTIYIHELDCPTHVKDTAKGAGLNDMKPDNVVCWIYVNNSQCEIHCVMDTFFQIAAEDAEWHKGFGPFGIPQAMQVLDQIMSL